MSQAQSNDNKPNIQAFTIVIENLGPRNIPVNDPSKTLLRHFQDNNLDWMHACGGKGRCTTCKVVVLRGIENFGSVTRAEERYRAIHQLRDNERLSCQARVSGPVTLVVPDECKLPHMPYSA